MNTRTTVIRQTSASSSLAAVALGLMLLGGFYKLVEPDLVGENQRLIVTWGEIVSVIWAALVLMALWICSSNTERAAEAAERTAKAAEETAAIFAGRKVVLDRGESGQSEGENQE